MPTDDFIISRLSVIIYTIPLSLASHVPPLTIPIPLEDLRQLTLRPAKLLRLIAWQLLGCAGQVVRQADSCELAWEASCDDLLPGTYNFVVAPGHNPGHVLNLADIYASSVISGSRRQSTAPSVSDTPNCLSEVDRRDIIARRDGGRCIFSAFSNVTHAHIISKQTGMNSDYIEALSLSRGFGFHHHRDPKNTLTLVRSFWDEFDAQEAFIVATDPDFLNDEDIPLPEEVRGSVGRDNRTCADSTSYIWQSLPRFHCSDGAVREFVAHNQRARFADPSLVDHLPSSAAINYVYVGALLKRYLPECERLRITAWNRNHHAPGASPSEAADEEERPRVIDGQLCEHTASDMQSSKNEAGNHSCNDASKQGAVTGFSPLELMSAIRHEVAVVEEQMVERSKKESLANWLGNST